MPICGQWDLRPGFQIKTKPFWNRTISEVSSKIWLPLEKTSLCSPFNCSHGEFSTVKSRTWFTIQKWKPTAYQLPINSVTTKSQYQEKTNMTVNVRKHKHEWVALDPGSTTFQTLYSPTQDIAYKFGHNDNVLLFQMNKRIEELDSRNDIVSKIQQLTLKYQLNTMVNITHAYVASFLCNNFNNIIIPPFVIANLWRHGEFLQVLMYEARIQNVNVFVRSEEYTTKTCTHCGKLNDVGTKKTFECQHCFIKIDRDLSGSRNIFLKNIGFV